MSLIKRILKWLFGPSLPVQPASIKQPTFIDYGGNIVLPSPDSLTQSLMYNFFFTSNNGDPSKLQTLLDQRLNFAQESSNLRYQAFAADVMITFATTQQDRSIPEQHKGFVAEKEIVCWVPAIEQVKRGGEWISNRFVWFVPYIVVDNVWALAAGREIFGFPKSMGTFQIPDDPNNANTFTSTTAAFKTYSPSSQLQELPFININQVADSSIDKPTTHFDDSKHAFSIFKDIVLAAENVWDDLSFRFCLHELEDLLNMRMFWTFLKQFRAFDSSTKASYQAIVEGPFNITAFHGGGILHHDYQLDINDLASAPVAQDLGISSGQKSRAALWVNIDFNAELGKELWKA